MTLDRRGADRMRESETTRMQGLAMKLRRTVSSAPDVPAGILSRPP